MEVLMKTAKLMEMVVVTMVSPAALQRHWERGGERTPSFFFLLGLPPRWEKGSPSGPWPPWLPEGRSPSEIGSLLCFSRFSRFSGTVSAAEHCFLNSRRSVTPIGLKF